MATQAWPWHPHKSASNSTQRAGGCKTLSVLATTASLRLLVAMCLLFSSFACTESVSDDSAAAEAEAKPIIKTVDRGPVSLSVTANRDRISIAERLELRVEVTAAEGIEVKMPEFGAQMNDFQIRDYRELPVETTDDGGRRYVQVYDLDIFLSGEYEVPAITAKYRDRRNESDSAGDTERTDDVENVADTPWAELTTDAFAITVESLLEGEFDPADFRDVKPVATLKADRQWMWAVWVGGSIGAVALIAIAVFVWRRRKARSGRTIVIPPHEWAFQQLRELADAKLIEAGCIKEFYYRLNEIVRTYIELRFSLMAPERTTEEFLEEMRSSGSLPSAYQPSLTAFLEACDMVKYARYEPGTSEIEQVFNTARDLVEQTKQVVATPREVAA